jgi:ketosteroid isomerase-like protein
MKTRSVVVLVGLAISFALPNFAQEKDAVDQQTLQQLEAKMKKYDEAVNNNDAAAVAALFTDDAVFVTDTGLLYGRQAVEKQYAEWFKGWHHSGVRVVGFGSCPITGQTGWRCDIELLGQVSDHHTRYCSRLRKERSQKTDCA